MEKNRLFNLVDIHLAWNQIKLFRFLKEHGRQYQKIVIAFSFTLMARKLTYKLIQKLNRIFPFDFTFIAGGPDASANPAGMLGSGFDYVVKGEGEYAFPALVSQIISQDRDQKWRIPSVYFRDNAGTIHYSRTRDYVDLEQFYTISERFQRFGAIEISRGCPHFCSFCQTSNFHGGTSIRNRSIDNITEQINIMERNRKKQIHFISPNAITYGSVDGKTVHPEKIHALLENVRKVVGPSGKINFGSFPSEARPEYLSDLVLKILKQFVNNHRINIGAQSASPALLKKLNRSHTVDDIYQSVELCHKNGFEAHLDFLFGTPEETEEDIHESLLAMRKIIQAGGYIRAHSFIPLPQTRYGKKAKKPLPRFLKRELHLLAATGRLDGNWQNQARINAT